MPNIGPGVAKTRIHTDTEHRVFYVARFKETVYVLHAFEKKTRKTPTRELDRGKARLAEVLKYRGTGSDRRTP